MEILRVVHIRAFTRVCQVPIPSSPRRRRCRRRAQRRARCRSHSPLISPRLPQRAAHVYSFLSQCSRAVLLKFLPLQSFFPILPSLSLVAVLPSSQPTLPLLHILLVPVPHPQYSSAHLITERALIAGIAQSALMTRNTSGNRTRYSCLQGYVPRLFFYRFFLDLNLPL